MPPKTSDMTNANTDSSCVNVLGSRSGKWATVPPECLSLIFEAGLESILPEYWEDATSEDDYDLCQFISSITQTCRWWHRVALETPRIWSKLILDEYTPITRLETWLARSKAAPLFINIGGDLAPGTPIATSLFPLLNKHVHHWARVYLQSDAPWGLETLLKGTEGRDAPFLEHLTLWQTPEHDAFPQEYSPIPTVNIFNGPGSAPKLVEVDIIGTQLDWSNSPFQNLKTLSLARIRTGEEMRIEEFQNLLLELQQLTVLRLITNVVRPDDLANAFQGTNHPPQQISVPCLKELTISRYGSPSIVNFTLALMHVPNLRLLQLADLDMDAEGFTMDFAPTIEFLGTGTLSSFEHLEGLDLRRLCCRSPAAWESLCARLTNLRALSLCRMAEGPIEYQDVYEGYLGALFRPNGVDSMGRDRLKIGCPNLRSVFVVGCSESTVIDFAKRRLKLGYGLERVTLGDDPSGGMVKELAELGVEWVWRSDIDLW
ncbi:hypothetical protein FRC01_012780 [Tulasnella sp. 417]|nr:hypothetical protein FRC01_012780 [Tulasnella sp. 417]